MYIINIYKKIDHKKECKKKDENQFDFNIVGKS